jgi:hypothetical protein
MINYIKSKILNYSSEREYKKSQLCNPKYNHDGSLEEILKTYTSRNELYNYFHHHFWNSAPEWLREHRNYFKKDLRGFGEDAFHVMWYFLVKEFHPGRVLEIGIYRGQVISLIALISDKINHEIEIHGISPFSPAGDQVSEYLKKIDYYNDVKKNFSRFSNNKPHLHKGFSTDPEMMNIINSYTWDLIYIDGNHDYQVVKKDFEVCCNSVKKGGIIVLDDSSLYTDYSPSSFSTAGHPGPSKLANELNDQAFKEVVSVGHNRVFQKL